MLRLELADSIATLTLARPPAHALDHALLEALADCLPRLSAPEVRSVIVTGSGRFFSAGLDLNALLDYSDREFEEFGGAFDRAFSGLFLLDKPVVAAINGHAIAGGAVLAAIADVRLMSEGPGRMGLTEVPIGVPFPTAALEPVANAFAGPHLREVLYRGATYSPTEAGARGLVDEVVSPEALMPRALQVARELGSHPPVGFAAAKDALRRDARARIREKLRTGTDPIWRGWRTPETRASIEAFRDRALKKRAGEGP